MEKKIKKTLILSSYAPPSNSGSGLMMYNILSQFPDNSLVILTSDNNQEPELQKYRIKAKYYYYGNKLFSLKFNEKNDGFLQNFKFKLKNFPPTKLLAQLILLIYTPIKIVRSGKKIIKNENIELLFGYSDFGINFLATYILHKITGIPFYLHFYDIYKDNKLPFFYKILSYYLEPKLFRYAKYIFVMCDELKEYYEKKYKREISVIYNSILFNQEKIKQFKFNNNTIKFNIIFLGNIYWAQKEPLLKLIRAIETINEFKINITLYTPHSEKYLNSIGIYRSNKIIFSSCLPEETQNVFLTADLLYIGLSFDQKYKKVINTSCPGKLCDYLISGKNILINAPSESFIIKYAKKFNFALTVDQNDIYEIKKTIINYYKNPTIYQTKIKNSLDLALKNHDAQKNFNKIIKFFQYE